MQFTLLEVLDYLPNGVIFVKDAEARYQYANATLLHRLGMASLIELIGRTSGDLFPHPLGESYLIQDRSVLAGQTLTDHLEMHLYPSGQVDWCLTTKRPLRAEDGSVYGLVGLSRDLNLPSHHLKEMGDFMAYLRRHYASPLTIQSLAERSNMSLSTFERQVRQLYGLTPSQLLMQVRIEAAAKFLKETDWPISRVAIECGYFDQSAFTRVFRKRVGLTPSKFRLM